MIVRGSSNHSLDDVLNRYHRHSCKLLFAPSFFEGCYNCGLCNVKQFSASSLEDVSGKSPAKVGAIIWTLDVGLTVNTTGRQTLKQGYALDTVWSDCLAECAGEAENLYRAELGLNNEQSLGNMDLQHVWTGKNKFCLSLINNMKEGLVHTAV